MNLYTEYEYKHKKIEVFFHVMNSTSTYTNYTIKHAKNVFCCARAPCYGSQALLPYSS
jgi:hypothetical protein